MNAETTTIEEVAAKKEAEAVKNGLCNNALAQLGAPHAMPKAKRLIEIKEVDNGYIVGMGFDYGANTILGYAQRQNEIFVAKSLGEALDLVHVKVEVKEEGVAQ